MLKRVLINKRTVPVPVPIRTLAEAFRWLEANLIPDGQTITSAVLDGKSVLELWNNTKVLDAILLGNDARFEVRIESPMDLALQGMETTHTLCGAILRDLKPLAVHLWQSRPSDPQPELAQVAEDVQLIMDLIDHSKDMGVESHMDFGPLIEFQAHIHKISLSLSAASARSDWRACAQILLRDTATTTGLESTLQALQEEVEASHLRLLTSRGATAQGQ